MKLILLSTSWIYYLRPVRLALQTMLVTVTELVKAKFTKIKRRREN